MNDNSFPWIPALTLIFVVLKLTGNITWSWWLVFSPVWIALVGGLALVSVAWLIGQVADWRDR